MKCLKFFNPLPAMILNGEKTITWRINDEKDIVVGDVLSFCNRDGQEFAQARVVRVWEREFGKFTDEEKSGHERFASDEEMYETYSRYYNMKVTPKTMVKVIKFELLKSNS